MKYFLLALFFFCAFCGVKSQTYLLETETYKVIKGLTADTIKGTGTLTKLFHANKQDEYNLKLQVTADSLKKDSTAYFILVGSVDGVKPYYLDTITWSMSTRDTTVLFDKTNYDWRFVGCMLKGNKAALRAKLTYSKLSIPKSN